VSSWWNAAAFAEVKAYGRLAESTRTEDQTFYADWWYELSDIGRNRIARVVWETQPLDPPIQDYPSTHSVLGAAGAEVLAYVFGTDVGFSMESTSSKPPGQLRSFPTFEAAALENADSRVACGIHFRFATEAGLEMGRQIGKHAVSTVLPVK